MEDLKMNTVPVRNLTFDFLKIILTVLVVNIHIRIITGKTQSNFLETYVWYAVPLFVTLSFFLTSKIFIKEKPNQVSFLRRLKRLLIPFIFWSGVGFLVRPELFSVGNTILQLFTGQIVNLPLYYLLLLLWYIVIYWLISYLPRRIRPFIYFGIIIIAFIVEYSQISYLFFSPFGEAIKKSYGRFVELIKYVSLGLLFADQAKFAKDKIKHLPYISIIFLFFYLVSVRIVPPPGFHYSGFSLFASTIFIFSLVLWVSRQNFAQIKNYFIEKLGKYSFGIYLFHFALLEYLLKIFPQMKHFIDGFPIIFLMLYMGGCYLLCFGADFITHKKFSFLIE